MELALIHPGVAGGRGKRGRGVRLYRGGHEVLWIYKSVSRKVHDGRGAPRKNETQKQHKRRSGAVERKEKRNVKKGSSKDRRRGTWTTVSWLSIFITEQGNGMEQKRLLKRDSKEREKKRTQRFLLKGSEKGSRLGAATSVSKCLPLIPWGGSFN